MVIDRAIVSTDNNPLYYEFWPLVAHGWRNIKIEPTVAIIGDLKLDHGLGTLVKIPLIDDIPSGFIAQVIRFIIPCLFPEEISITADIDMIPLSKTYFSTDIAAYDDKILIFSADAYKNELRYPMCYIAAKGKYFQEIIGLKNTELSTIQQFIRDLYALNLKWDTDELFFTRKLHESPLVNKAVLLNRGWQPYAKNRIDRSDWKYNKMGIFFNKYIDTHCLRPRHQYTRELSTLVDYIAHGSDGKIYFNYWLKKPVKNLINFLKLMKQNMFSESLYNILEIRSINHTKKNIISFSLYGSDKRYIGCLESVITSYNKLLPDWKCRVYVAKDVDEKAINLIIDKGCDVIIMDKAGVDARYTMWRFLAIEDKDADATIIRDIDSHALKREKTMLEQWLNSGKKFHIIRDHVNHTSKILAGTFGIRRNNIDIRKKSKKMLLSNHYGVDQEFLGNIIYPLIGNDLLVHDVFLRNYNEEPIILPLQSGESYVGEITTDDKLKKRDNRVNSYADKVFKLK